MSFLYKAAFAPLYVNPSKLAGKTRPCSPTPASAASTYVGSYANDLYGPAHIVAAPGGLALQLGPNSTAYPLQHWDGDTFSYLPTGENALGITAVTFTIGAGGVPGSVSIENFNGQEPETANLGLFQRA